ncbi:flagellar protein export ATPase FliI [Saccharophagus degradans]|uniref:Flagellum-specific ATP synthase n=1 Tax=Saccharophagus degradans TaxID=86304 RepID=A0AAW7X0H3_9GAMM|nr:flagellar protein export ATPase FliI [Saccharophagus degradans]MDO6421004.1 flagellar protein export ATPase FliI [Saccharophagus degradans]MDO6606085.1 flagellar protein export ATPase FliI [Saccharophagus degradans]WGP00320.1 flagellar protein export ATPase FliI [Saccharophagus degradans]
MTRHDSIGTPIAERLKPFRNYKLLDHLPTAQGRLTRMVGLTLEAVGLNVPVGSQCRVVLPHNKNIDAEVVGFNGDKTYLMPVQKVEGLQPGARVVPLDAHQHMAIGEHLRGRIINGIGQPLDGKGPLPGKSNVDMAPSAINPLSRHPIDAPLDVGVRAINGLLTVGRGQRIGLFAGSGVGKSVLLGMMTRFTTADIVVVGLIGERGREVKEFIDQILGDAGMSRAVVIASPADDAPLMRLRAAELCTRVAEFFRDQGLNCLLLMDSLTRYAQAQREISLAIGEPPATKGYPPSVFSKIPELVERAGNADKGGGSITAFYTVLTEGDDLQDPIADSARAILDGHIVLSRDLAEEGIYPAIDISASVSRVMPSIVTPDHLQKAQKFKALLSRYRANKDLISIGAYTPGTDPNIDGAIERYPHLNKYICQGMKEASGLVPSMEQLFNVIAPTERTERKLGG